MDADQKSGVWRRWYTWAMVATLVIAAGVGVAVMRLPGVQPRYTSTGTIWIRPALDQLIYPTEFNQRRPDYDQFLVTQLSYLRNQITLQLAMGLTMSQLQRMDRDDLERTPEKVKQRNWRWAEMTWPDIIKDAAPPWRTAGYDEQLDRLTQGLKVQLIPGAELLMISFTDPDKSLAAATVKLIIAAYRLHYDVDVDNYNLRLQKLDDKEKSLTASVESQKKTIHVDVAPYSSADYMMQSLEQKQTEMLQMDELYGSTETQVKAMALNAFRRAQELFDAGYYLRANAALNPALKVWSDLWSGTDRRSDDAHQLHAKIAEKLPLGTVTTAETQESSLFVSENGQISLADANDRLKILGERRDTMASRITKLQDMAMQVRAKVTDLKKTEKELDDVKSAKGTLVFEGVSGGRMQVINPGDMPTKPAKDGRLSAAVASGSGTAGLGLAIIGIVGLGKWWRGRRAGGGTGAGGGA